MEYMTRDEMIRFIKTSPFIHISHVLFSEDEYIYSDIGGLVWDESGYLFEGWESTNKYFGTNGIRMRAGGNWENGWYIKE
jgi:hypothetical protein